MRISPSARIFLASTVSVHDCISSYVNVIMKKSYEPLFFETMFAQLISHNFFSVLGSIYFKFFNMKLD